MNKVIIMLLLMATSISGYAQKNVSGTVTDDKGELLPGVTVLIKGTKKGTGTDFSGAFDLKDVSESATLVFSYLGYETIEVNVKGKVKFKIVMTSNSEELEEVVIVGYGQRVKIEELTVSAVKIKSEDLENTATTNFDQALAGRAAGVQVSSNDGTPGNSLNIVIRGGNSITGDNSPLYVVDGIPLEDFDPASISTADIETFQVLKDAAATAIYGSRGANGIIIITTKDGRTDGKTSVKLSSSHSIQFIPRRLEVLGPTDYLKYQLAGALATDNYTPSTPDSEVSDFYNRWGDPSLYNGLKGTSWQDEIFQVAHTDQHNLSVSGGNKTSSIYLSTEFLDQEGTMINTGFKKFTSNLKFTHKFGENSSIRANFQYAYANRLGLNVSGDRYISVIRDAIQFRPIEPINSDGNEIGGVDPNDGNERFFFNPVKNLENTDRQDRFDNVRGNLIFRTKLTDKFSLNLRGNYQINNRRFSLFYGQETVQGTRGNDKINGRIDNRRNTVLSTSNTLNYKNKIGKHRINALIGMEAQDRAGEYSRLKNSQIPTDIFGIDKLGIGISPSIPETEASKNRLLSYFGSLNYSYKGKYLLTAVFRADGSSKFSKQNRWGYFPSASLGWRMDKEKFIKDIDFISAAKLRVGWGITGNNRIRDFEAFSQLNINSGSGYVWGDTETFIPGAFQSNLGVPDLKWETTEQFDIGFDFGVLKNRIGGTIDYYKKTTSDLLLRAESALHTGFDRVQQNVGAVENQGLEITLNSSNIDNPKFKWNSSVNISFNKNKTLGLNNGQTRILQDPEWKNDSEPQYITEVGSPVGMMYGLVYDGIYQVDDFVSGTTLKDGIPDNGTTPVAPGSIKFVDQNGDGTINIDDRVVIGNPQPKHFGGFSNDFRIGGFDIQVLLQWSYDFDILNANASEFSVARTNNRNGFPALADAWTPTNTSTDVNAFKYLNVFGAPPNGNTIDNRYVEDGSYIKLKTVSIGYSVPKDVLEKMNIKGLRLFISGQNLAVWTNYTGYDPDVSVGRYGALTPNLDWSSYPQSVTVMTGVNITF